MATVNEKMTALANEIRELSGTTVVKGIDAMTTDVSAANTEIADQTDLIEQIAAALHGKSSGGSGSGYNTIYIGATEPTSDIGVNGDIYIIRSAVT